MLLLLLLYIASKYIRKWLELPVSATLSNVFIPPHSKFGLNIILPSTKFIQHQTVSRSALKYSPNVDINNLWTVTSTNKNIQYDIYKDTKDVLKAVRKESEERLQNNLILQGSFFPSIINNSTSTFNSLWLSVQSKLSKNIFNFTIRYRNRGAIPRRQAGFYPVIFYYPPKKWGACPPPVRRSLRLGMARLCS